MRLLINELALVFGVQHTASITNWVNTQYLFKGRYEGSEFTLHDVEETKVIKAIVSACTELELSLSLLLNGVWIVPVLTPLQLEFDASVELRPEAFKIAAKGSLRIAQEGFVKRGDIVEVTGSDRHIKHEKSSFAEDSIELSYFNAFVNPGAEQFPLSCSMTGAELAEVKRSYVENKFCGADPFNDQEWSEIQLASVYRRFVSTSIFSAMHSTLNAEAAKLLNVMASFGHAKFEQNMNDLSFNVYTSYGKQIGHKIFRHTATDCLNKVGEGATVLEFKPPMQKTVPAKVAAPVNSNNDDVATEWGAF